MNGRAARRGVLQVWVGKLGEALSLGVEKPGRDRSGGAGAGAEASVEATCVRSHVLPWSAARSVRLAVAN